MKPIQVIFAITWMCNYVRGAPHMDGDRIVGFDDFDEYKVQICINTMNVNRIFPEFSPSPLASYE